MGDKIIDQAFIRSLGAQIVTSADAELPSASQDAAAAQTAMYTAGQAGGLLPVLGFFFAAEYVEHAWGTKNTTAGELDDGLQQIAANWHEVEQQNISGSTGSEGPR